MIRVGLLAEHSPLTTLILSSGGWEPPMPSPTHGQAEGDHRQLLATSPKGPRNHPAVLPDSQEASLPEQLTLHTVLLLLLSVPVPNFPVKACRTGLEKQNHPSVCARPPTRSLPRSQDLLPFPPSLLQPRLWAPPRSPKPWDLSHSGPAVPQAGPAPTAPSPGCAVCSVLGHFLKQRSQ